MTITFISNYINHHQIPFSNACYELLKEDYHFIQTQPMEEERLPMCIVYTRKKNYAVNSLWKVMFCWQDGQVMKNC